ncbi:MAG: hypothetical protein V1846_00470 [Candidatus Komeilibacteria bacterium]
MREWEAVCQTCKQTFQVKAWSEDEAIRLARLQHERAVIQGTIPCTENFGMITSATKVG